MTTTFNYDLTGTGWAEVWISNGSTTANFDVSYLSDPLKELLQPLIRILKKESNSELVEFAEEPGETYLFLELKPNNQIEIKIYWNDEWAENIDDIYSIRDKIKIIYFDIDELRNFSVFIAEGISALLKKYGEKGYFEKWSEYEFPKNELFELNALLQLSN